MDFSIKTVALHESSALNAIINEKIDCLAIGFFDDEPMQLTSICQQIDQITQGRLTRFIQLGDLNRRAAVCFIPGCSGIGAARLLIVNLGKRQHFDSKGYVDVVQAAFKQIKTTQIKQLLWALPAPEFGLASVAWAVKKTVQYAREICYQFTELKTQREVVDQPVLKQCTLIVPNEHQENSKHALKQGLALADGVQLARDLANLPANICTPTYLAQKAQELAQYDSLSVEILDQQQIEALKMGAFLSVAKGSAAAPRFIILKYKAHGDMQAPIVLVGKGITFDAGGISLKPSEGMEDMKFDMCGAASVLGTMLFCAKMGLKQSVIGVIAACENLPSGTANKPGDVVTSMLGKTIEIINTDAEGRLVLSDALTYIERFHPKMVIDIATLTGACVVALGHVRSGLFSKDDALAQALFDAGESSLDKVWRLPLDEAYQEQIKSDYADIKNLGGRAAGSVTAACFLAHFTENYSWAHLDIAGTAYQAKGKIKGATGRPVPLLVEFLMMQADDTD